MESQGLQVMSMGFFMDDTMPVIWRGPLLIKAVDQFINNVHTLIWTISSLIYPQVPEMFR